MPGFHQEYDLAIRQVSATEFQLINPLVYVGSSEVFIVPDGQTTDLASVPAVLRALFAPYGMWTNAAVLHDYLWRVLAPHGWIRYRDADGILRQALGTLGVGTVRRYLMWAAVRWGALLSRRNGWRGWWRDAPAVVPITIAAAPFAAVAAAGAVPALLLLAATAWIGRGRTPEGNTR